MENYFAFIQLALASLGIRFGSQEKKFDIFWRAAAVASVTIASIQSFLLLLTTSFQGSFAGAFTTGFYSVQGLFKIVIVLWNFEELKKLKKTLTELMVSEKAYNRDQNIKDLNGFRLLTKSVLLINVISMWTFILRPLVAFIYYYYTQGTTVKSFLFSFYYPFEPLDHFCPVYLYEAFFGHILTVVPQAMDGLIFLMAGQIAVLFNCVGDNFYKIVNEYDTTRPSVTAGRLKDNIDLHENIFELSEKLFGIYAIPLLANIILETGTVCFIAFMISVKLGVSRNIS